MRTRFLLYILLSLLPGTVLLADPPAKLVEALPLGDEEPDVDGKLDDPLWKRARGITDFRQKDPIEFADPSNRTEVLFAYDQDNLYVAATMWIESSDDLSKIVTRRDNSGATDRIIISLDTYRDRRTAYSFSVTAAGVRTDYYHGSDSEYDRDYSFDPVWEAKTWVGTDRWTAEIRIPFSQLRFNDINEQVWGLNINRYMPQRKEDLYWIVVPKDETGWSSRMGELRGIRGVHPSTRVELLPYVAAGATLPSEVDPDNPYVDELNLNGRVGLDAKIGLGPNLTLDATINPDFGQVEADPAEVNLSAFETFFSERRPFFVEGGGLFSYKGGRHYYSRRIGGSPHGYPSGNFIYADVPDNSTILGAAKLTGRLPSGLSIGALAAVTEREYARAADLPTQSEVEYEVEPLTLYGVARAQQEFGEDASTVGLIGTIAHRDMDEMNPNNSILTQDALTGGTDWELRLDGGSYEFEGNLAFSHVRGSESAISRIQRSSTHYFQRPDADYVTFDSTRTALTGYAGSLAFSRKTGEWVYGIGGTFESPNYELNDAGSLSSADDIDLWGYLTYRENQPSKLFRSWDLSVEASANWNYGLVRQYVSGNVQSNLTWQNFWYNYVGVGATINGLSDRKTRGGPLMDEPDILFNAWAGMGNNFGSKIRWSGHFGFGIYEYDGWFINTSGSLAANLGDRLEFSLSPKYYSELLPRQYVVTQDGGGEETFGKRYIFSDLKFSRLSTQIRLSYAITPNLTLELYAEPFVANGKYDHFGELAQAGTGKIDSYDGRIVADSSGTFYIVTDGAEQVVVPNFDFVSRSFRSNIVLRWEWLPGSTFYLVWQQSRSDYLRERGDIGSTDWIDALGDPGDMFFALKLSYWLPVD
ncbi:MAG: carbohydrate binding family 9 domain-containing protein [Ignavibacteriae bacterium]|nr:carbohydrate binding family 9 domain-containing protein [Ignavibacteriota bacterium]MCB9215635.1 carbohydrate binding family 9 domain-containing protein [Ignavibacteria bacterium]